MAKLVIKKVSDIGAGHPVLARLFVQISDAIHFSSSSSEVKTAVLETCFDKLVPRLARCWRIWERIQSHEENGTGRYIPSCEMVVQIPQVNDLERDVENFLYEAKNFLRDLMNGVIRAFYPDIAFRDARSFFDCRDQKDSRLTQWAESKFGRDDELVSALREDQAWIAELVNKRNAVEHPNGRSGLLLVENFERLNDGN